MCGRLGPECFRGAVPGTLNGSLVPKPGCPGSKTNRLVFQQQNSKATLLCSMQYARPRSSDVRARRLMCRRYARAQDAVGGWITTFTMRNLDPYNAVEIGALGMPLCFQVTPPWMAVLLHQIAQGPQHKHSNWQVAANYLDQ